MINKEYEIYNLSKKSVIIAYLLWFFIPIGIHRIYANVSYGILMLFLYITSIAGSFASTIITLFIMEITNSAYSFYFSFIITIIFYILMGIYFIWWIYDGIKLHQWINEFNISLIKKI